MNYFDEMLTKYGFSSGASVPREAEACRTIYVRTMNKLLEKFGSGVRLVAFDGYKNPYLIVLVTKEQFKDFTWDVSVQDQRTDKLLNLYNEPLFDEAGNESVEAANKMMLDDLVEINVNLPKDLDEQIDDAISRI